MSDRSDWFRSERMFDLDRYPNWEGLVTPMWDSTERPPDPMAWRIRRVMEDHLTPSHREVLELKYFEQKSTKEIARERGSTDRAVRGMLERARNNLMRALAMHGAEYTEVPDDEV